MQLTHLLLDSPNDIPFIPAQLTVHVPRVQEVGLLSNGESTLFIGAQYLTLTKNDLSEEDRARLGNLTNFDIIMKINQQHTPDIQKNKVMAEEVLVLLFPNWNISFSPIGLILRNEENEVKQIKKDDFDSFQDIVRSIFCLNELSVNGEKKYNPGNKAAQRLADKFRKYHEKLAKMKKSEGGQDISILDRYVSILSVGEHKDKNELMQYTVYQLIDEFKRYELKEESDIHQRALLAGAQNLKETENWMKDIHSDNDD